MADPVSMMAVASLGMTAIGGGVGAYGSYQGGRFTQTMYNYQSNVAAMNAQIQENNANYSTVAGDIKAQVAGVQGAEKVGMTRAGQAAGNLSTGSGSAKQVTSSETEVTQFNEATIRNTAAREAYGYRVSEAGDVAQSRLDVAAGEGARESGDIGAVTSILGAGTSVSTKWAQYGNAGILPNTWGT